MRLSWPNLRRAVMGEAARPEREAGIVLSGEALVLGETWTVEANRALIEQDIETMVLNCPIVGTALEQVTEYGVVFDEPDRHASFIVRTKDKRVQEVLDALTQRVGLDALMYPMTYGTLKYGNYFFEIIYAPDMSQIARVKLIPTPQSIRRNETPEGVLLPGGPGAPEGQAAFEQYAAGRRVGAFYPWQMHHLRFPPNAKKYAEPQLTDMTKLWAGYRILRNRDLGFRAQTPPVMRVHKVPVPAHFGPDDTRRLLNVYKDNISEKRGVMLTDPDQIRGLTRGKVPNDVYLPTRYTADGRVIEASIDLLNLTTGTFDRDEMMFFINHLFTRLRVPPKFLFWDMGQARIAEGSSDPQEVPLVKFTSTLQRETAGALKRLMDTELLLHGIVPEPGMYRIVLPSRHTTSQLMRARAAALMGQSILMTAQTGVPTDWWMHYVLGIDQDDIALAGDMIPPPPKSTTPPPKTAAASVGDADDSDPELVDAYELLAHLGRG